MIFCLRSPRRTASAPAVERRAPLRHSSPRPGQPWFMRCSRRRTAGSIAAPPPAETRWPGLRCSRRRTAGSIAATSPPATSRSTTSAPAVERRAPLRQLAALDEARAFFGCSRRRTAGSIAARPRSSRLPGPTWVLPPSNGGLHCGGVMIRSIARKSLGAPAVERRAPLRLVAWVSKHATRVLPPSNGGLHCGINITIAVFECYHLRPPSERRAPFVSCEPCVRRRTAGSIAAPRSRRRASCSSRCSPRRTAGSIAAT